MRQVAQGSATQLLRRGLLWFAAILLLALCGPWLAPHDLTALRGEVYGPVLSGAPLGFDYLGRDVLSRVLAGGRSLVLMSLAAATLALLVGTVLGLLAGFSRGWADRLLQWLADLSLAFPDLILVLLVVSLLGREPWLIVASVAFAFLPGTLRLARSSALALAGQEFVEAVRLLGVPRWRILLGEILPNMLGPLLVHYGNLLTWAVGILSGLSFLGYGVAPPAADWGLMIQENQMGLRLQPWPVLLPVLLIASFAYACDLLAEGVSRCFQEGSHV
ncbi:MULTISPECIES: ABC transporter permease [Pseudomonas]|uniref:ABC transporter permease n=1 Tax=Pseudomonas TaxID=286 RepID=UPI002B40B31A|nr:ABC transporter permease [Pseudomonas sichuanensis]